MKLRYYLRGLGIGIAVTALIMGLSDQDARPLTDAEIKAKAATLGMVESDSLRLADVSVTPEEESQFPEKESSGESTQSPEKELSVEPAQSPEEESSGESTQSPEESSGEPSQSPEEESSGESTQSPEESNGEPTQSPEKESSGESTQSPEKESSGEPQPSDAEAEQPSPPPETGESDVDAFSGQEETVSITIEAGSGSGTVCRQLEEAGLIKSAATFDRYLIDNGYSKRISTGTYEIRIGSAEEEIAKIITKTR